MHNNAVLPTFCHPPSYSSTPGHLPGVHRGSKSEEPGSEAGTLRGPIGSLPDTHFPSQDPHTPIALVESIDWKPIPAWVPEVISPSPRGVLGGAGVPGAVLPTYPAYSDLHFNQDLPLTAHESALQTMRRPGLAHPHGQMVHAGADSGPLSFLEEMECQSVPKMTYVGRSPSGPSSAFLDRDGLLSWSGPDHTLPSISDHHDRVPFGLLSNPLESVSSPRSIESTPDLKLRPADGLPIVIPKLYTVPAPPLPAPVLSNWRRIPQKRYTQRKGHRYLLQAQEITFSVNNTRGFSMENALGGVFTGLDGRDSPVLENANGPVSCRLLFPGYPTNTRCSQIAVRNWKKEPAPITKSKLAHEIAKRVKQYLDALATIPIDPSVDARWTIGQGCMRLEKMYLVSVAWVSKGSLQPEIWVDDS